MIELLDGLCLQITNRYGCAFATKSINPSMPAWLLDRPNKDGCYDYIRLTWNLRPAYILGNHQAQAN